MTQRSAIDFLATRLGFLFGVLLICVICGSAVFYIKAGARSWTESQEVYQNRRLRNGFVAISDMQRVLSLVYSAAANNEPLASVEDDLIAALDILYVRADVYQYRENEAMAYDAAKSSSQVLFEMVDVADAALARGDVDPTDLLLRLNELSEEARRRIVVFLDEMQNTQDRLMSENAQQLKTQNVTLSLAFVGVALLGTIALWLLRLEVSARQARAKAERRADFLAYYDPLTELPNRVQFTDLLTARIEAGAPMALFFIDLDRFKSINDTFGHAGGDAVLCKIGSRLRDAAEAAGGVAARLSGDEFALFVPFSCRTAVAFTADSLLESLRVPFTFEADTITPGASIGAATTDQVGLNDEVSHRTLARAADFALYASKEAGRNCVTIFNLTLEQLMLERRTLVELLPVAIKDGQLEVFLQPKVALPDAQVYGFEALVRWKYKGAYIPPDEFISVAEESGAVQEIDLFVLHDSCARLAQANARNGSNFTVSVNLSALHFNSTRFIQEVAAALASSGLPPHLLTLEITESVEIQDWSRFQRTFAALREVGCKISVDDFGSGYSSMAYLRNIDADEIKIDRTLVSEIATSSDARVIIAAIINLCNALNMEIVVEGIEDWPQAEMLHAMGCQRAQGYLFGRP